MTDSIMIMQTGFLLSHIILSYRESIEMVQKIEFLEEISVFGSPSPKSSFCQYVCLQSCRENYDRFRRNLLLCIKQVAIDQRKGIFEHFENQPSRYWPKTPRNTICNKFIKIYILWLPYTMVLPKNFNPHSKYKRKNSNIAKLSNIYLFKYCYVTFYFVILILNIIETFGTTRC